MDNPKAGLLLVMILFFILADGFFALAETALTESHKSRLEKLADDGNADAENALHLMEAPEKILSVVQIGITFMSILLGSCAGALAAPRAAELLSFATLTLTRRDGLPPHPAIPSLRFHQHIWMRQAE